MAVPKLRFKEFGSEYNEYNLGKLLKSYRLGGNYSNSEIKTNLPLIKMGNLNRGSINLSKIEYIPSDEIIDDQDQIQLGDLFFNTRNTLDLVGKVAIWRNELPVAYYNSNLMRLEFENNFYMNFLLNTEKSLEKLKAIASGTTSVAAIYTKDLLKVKVKIPFVDEQTKIASFLSNVDEKISQLTQKHELLSQYKQGMMQKLFSQQIRFKADDGSEFGEWEEKTLNEIASKQSNKNKDDSITEVLTNSAIQGIIKQSDYFDREIVTESNLNGYYIVNLNDFVYNPRISVHAPVGPIKRNKKCLGVMSPLYTVFTVNEGDLTYLEYFFDSNFWHDYVKSVANSGARHDRMNITNKDFFDMPILYPCLEEQTKIANFLSAIDQKIEGVAQQIEQAKTWKKGLLQQMFV
nr:restriction endonuclease subunit S [Acinetobacter junii]